MTKAKIKNFSIDSLGRATVQSQISDTVLGVLSTKGSTGFSGDLAPKMKRVFMGLADCTVAERGNPVLSPRICRLPDFVSVFR